MNADLEDLKRRIERLERIVAALETNAAPKPGSELHQLREEVKRLGLPTGERHPENIIARMSEKRESNERL